MDRQELVSCINEKLFTRKEYLQQVRDFFAPIKADQTKEWKIPFKIGDYDSVRINKIFTYYHNKHWWESKETAIKRQKLINIDFYMSYSSTNIDKISIMDLKDFVDHLDDILLIMGAQDGCNGTGPAIVSNNKPSSSFETFGKSVKA